MLSEFKAQLDRIEAKLDALMEDAGVEPYAPVCAYCGGDRLEDTSTTSPRVTCLTCGKSTPSEQEAAIG